MRRLEALLAAAVAREARVRRMRQLLLACRPGFGVTYFSSAKKGEPFTDGAGLT